MGPNSPPPPPPHGDKPQTTGGEYYRKASDLPPGNYDIFIIPPHSSGSGFIYLPSLQCHRNSFIAGSLSTLVMVMIWSTIQPVFSTAPASAGPGLIVLAVCIAISGWAWALLQQGGAIPGSPRGGGSAGGSSEKDQSTGTGDYPSTGSDPGAQHTGQDSDGQFPGGSASGSPHHGGQSDQPSSASDEARRREEQEREERRQQEEKEQEEEREREEARRREEQEREERRRKEEKEREGARRKEEVRRKLDEFKKKREAEAREKERQREKEAMEKELRERKEQLEKEAAAAKEAAEREAREKVERELAEAKAKAAKEAAEREAAMEEARKKEMEAKFAAAREEALRKFAAREAAAKQAAAREAEARERAAREAVARQQAVKEAAKTPTGSEARRSPSPKKPAPSAAAAEDDAYSFRPLERTRRPYAGTSSSSILSESSYAPSQSTARTTPPPSTRGGYSTKDPDKIVIRGVYAFNSTLMKTPIAQLVSGEGSVTDGLVLRITTEGLFIDDDVRGVAQREWDVKAWTMRQVEVWCPKFGALPLHDSPSKANLFRRSATHTVPTSEESDALLVTLLRVCENTCRLATGSTCFNQNDGKVGQNEKKNAEVQSLHILRASMRDQEGKKYVFVLEETEGWKVAAGLQRLRGGTQVRALGVTGMNPVERKTLLENLGYI
ncbi:hypothetical protein VTN02DRAFT_5516 [Thermoascus thermophilus]